MEQYLRVPVHGAAGIIMEQQQISWNIKFTWDIFFTYGAGTVHTDEQKSQTNSTSSHSTFCSLLTASVIVYKYFLQPGIVSGEFFVPVILEGTVTCPA